MNSKTDTIASRFEHSRLGQTLKKYGLYRLETLIFSAALFTGLFGAILQHANQKSFERSILENYRLTTILVANSRLDEGTILRPEHVSEIGILEASKTDNMLTPDDLDRVLGKGLQISLAAGDPMLATALGASGVKNSVADRIPEGKRLYTMLVDDPVSRNGFVKPGDWVDIIARMDFPNKGLTTFTIMSKVQLTAVGKSVDPNLGVSATEISFIVNPSEMEQLKFAEEKGKFSVSLRNPYDQSQIKGGKGVSFDTFMSSDFVYDSAEQPVKIIQGTSPREQEKQK